MRRAKTTLEHELGQDAHREANSMVVRGMVTSKRGNRAKRISRPEEEQPELASEMPQISTETVLPDNFIAEPVKRQNKGVKIADCKAKADSLLKTALYLVERGNEISSRYADLDIGVFDYAALTDAVTNRGAKTAKIWAESETAKLNGLPISLRSEAAQKIKANDTPFMKHVRTMQINGTDIQALKYLIVDGNGMVAIADDAAEKIADDAAVWIDEPDDIAKYEKHCKLIEALNDFFELDEGANLPVGWLNLFPFWGGKFILPEGGTDYSKIGVTKTAEQQNLM